MKNLRILSIALALCNSFIINNINFNPQENIKGVWMVEDYQGQEIIFEKHQSLEDDEPGYEFLTDGKLIKRQNAGWCGTPPISYSNFEGAWTMQSDSTLMIEYAYWGGTIKENWKISTLEQDKLKVTVLDIVTTNERKY